MLTEPNHSTKINKRFYQLTYIYWLTLPVIFISYLFLKANIDKMGIQLLLTTNPILAVLLLISLMTPFSSLFLMKLPDSEKYVSKAAGHFLKFAMIQQLVVGNLLGVGLSFLSLKEMPIGEKDNQRKQTGLVVVIIFEIIFTGIALFAITRLLF